MKHGRTCWGTVAMVNNVDLWEPGETWSNMVGLGGTWLEFWESTDVAKIYGQSGNPRDIIEICKSAGNRKHQRRHNNGKKYESC